MKFGNPWFLLLLLIPAAFFAWKYLAHRIFNRKKTDLEPSLYYSSSQLLPGKPTLLARLFPIVSDILIGIALLFFIIALARPLGRQAITNEKFYGIDMILALDVSGSMLNVDRIPADMPYRDMYGTRVYQDNDGRLAQLSRIVSARRVISNYVQKQTYNRIGIVLFAGYSYTKCPLTLDKDMLTKIISEIRFQPDNDGTAIGMGIATAINRLKKSEARSCVIILLTDGINNTGLVAPLSAAEIARDMGIRIYTIGVGNPQGFLAPANLELKQYVVQQGEGLDEAALQKIADTTGGKFYRAYESGSLEKIYEDIDKLEKSKIEVKRRMVYRENFLPFLIAGLVFLSLYIVLTAVVIKIP